MSRRIRGLGLSLCAILLTGAFGIRAFAEDEVVVLSPKNLQVVQRETKAAGHVLFSGRVNAGDCDKVEVHVTGKSAEGNELPDKWQAVDYAGPSKSFLGKIELPAGGWYKVEIRASKGDQPVGKTVTIEKVGVGEVFVIAGQSNSTNSGQFKTKQTSGMVSSFSGSDWRIADDPQPGVHDTTQSGSPWPAFGDAMYAKYKVPIGIASSGFGGTNTNQWQPDAPPLPKFKDNLFDWTVTRIRELGPGGFRALLWHQGESDAIGGMKADDTFAKMSTLIRESKKQAGWEFPWFVAQVSYIKPGMEKIDATRNAQKKLWDEGIALEGPDTDTLTGDNRDMDGKGIHFSPKGLKAHGEMWADKVGAYLDKVLH